jgi:hypothetical protein
MYLIGMKFRPGLRAISITHLIYISLLYTASITVVGILRGFGAVAYLLYLGLIVTILTTLQHLASVRLIVYMRPKHIKDVVNGVYETMRIDHHNVGNTIILDRSGIETKVISIGFAGLVVLRGGKWSAISYLTSVIKKFINYRKN